MTLSCVQLVNSFTDVPLFEKVGFSVTFNHDESLDGKANYMRNQIQSIP